MNSKSNVFKKEGSCPNCGSGKSSFNGYYECGQKIAAWPDFSGQTELCRTRCELAAIKAKHQRLVDAAMKVAGEAVKITGGMGEFVGWEIDVDDMTYLKKELESETNNG